MTSPLLLMASMQFFSISWPGRLGFPESVYWFPGPVILSHAAPIRPLTVMCEHRSNALPSTKLKLTCRELRLSVRLILAILGDERSCVGRAAGRGHPPVLAGA